MRCVGLVLCALVASAFLATPVCTGQALQKNERELENAIPEHIPIKVKIKKESEATFKDLINEKWPSNFELELTNTGTKSIYAVKLLLRTDDQIFGDCRMTFSLNYGRTMKSMVKDFHAHPKCDYCASRLSGSTEYTL